MVAVNLLSAALLIGAVIAHPGETHDTHHMKREIVARDHAAKNAARSLGTCSNSQTARSLKQRAVARRAQQVKSLRAKRNIKSRMSIYTLEKQKC